MFNFEEMLENLNEINVDNANQVEKLGEGSLGTVYKLQNPKNPEEPIAIKCMKKAKIINELVGFEQDAYHKLRESSINVIKYYDTKERVM